MMASERPVLDDAWNYFLSQQRVPREVLYHYTTLDALLNIIKTKRMWATELRFMNDPDELKYGLGVISRALIESAARQRDAQRALWLTLMQQQLRELIRKSTVYAISFCQDADLPTQWMQYGSAGRGVVLGWSVDSDYPEIPLKIPVEYDRRRQDELVHTLIEMHLNALRAHSNLTRGPGPELAGRVAGSLGIFLNIFATNFKHARWASENEFRYVYQSLSGKPPAGTVQRVRADGPISKPYVETDFSTAALRVIILGPRSDAANSGYGALRDALDAAGYQGTPLYRSGVPPTSLQ